MFVSHETTLTGDPIQLLHLVRRLKKGGWELAVVAPESGPISEILAANGVDVVIYPDLLEEPRSAKLRELAAQFDVVVANTVVSWRAVKGRKAFAA